MGKWLSPVWGSMVSKQELGPLTQKARLRRSSQASFSFPQPLPLASLGSEISLGCCAFLPLSGLFSLEISTPPAVTPSDPLETQTLCSGSVRGQPPPPSRGGGEERGRADHVSPCPGNGMHTGVPPLQGGGRQAQPSAWGRGGSYRPFGWNLCSRLFPGTTATTTKKPLEQLWLPSYKSGQSTSSQGGIKWTSAPASHTALPQRLPLGPVVYPLLLQLVSRLPYRQDADCNFITFPSTPHAHFYLRLCTYRFCLFVFYDDDFPFV